MGFKLGSQSRNITKSNRFGKKDDPSIPGTPVFRKSLGPGILGEANNDGSIFISDTIEPGSPLEEHTLVHEMKHQVDMKTGKLGYGDDYVKWEGQTFPRKDGKIKYYGEWLHEGSKDFPWEKH
tara:strand:- start:489 stop:857 length:369 start_codon:yes stop_codon:yes gene_type:complete